jgi:hypothetical protein
VITAITCNFEPGERLRARHDKRRHPDGRSDNMHKAADTGAKARCEPLRTAARKGSGRNVEYPGSGVSATKSAAAKNSGKVWKSSIRLPLDRADRDAC